MPAVELSEVSAVINGSDNNRVDDGQSSVASQFDDPSVPENGDNESDDGGRSINPAVSENGESEREHGSDNQVSSMPNTSFPIELANGEADRVNADGFDVNRGDAGSEDEEADERTHDCCKYFVNGWFNCVNWSVIILGFGTTIVSIWLMACAGAVLFSVGVLILAVLLTAASTAFGPTCKRNLAFAGMLCCNWAEGLPPQFLLMSWLPRDMTVLFDVLLFCLWLQVDNKT